MKEDVDSQGGQQMSQRSKRPANEQIPTAVKSDGTPDIRVIVFKF